MIALALSNPLGYACNMQAVAETPMFTKQAEALFDDVEKQELIAFLAANPLSGDIIPGTGGVRKVRFSASGRGKRGGSRVIYYYLDQHVPLYALLVFAKNVKADLTPADKKAATALVEAIKAMRKKT